MLFLGSIGLLVTSIFSLASEIELPAGTRIDRFLDYPQLHAFTWDDHGTLFVLSGKENRLTISKVREPGQVEPVGSFARRGNQRSGLLVHAGRAFVSDADGIRKFQIASGMYLTEEAALVATPELFPRYTQIKSLYWSPLGHIWFNYQASRSEEIGIGRVHVRHGTWDLVAKGVAGDLAFDVNGFPIASDELSDQLFRLGLGFDYQRGLENFTKKDVALHTGQPGLKPRALASWPQGTDSSLVVVDRETSTLKQFKADDERMTYVRDLARWQNATTIADLQVGPEGALWILAESKNSLATLFRLALPQAAETVDVASLPTKQVVALLKSTNSWQRDTALRVLEGRDELRHARGLHPNTPMHELYNDRELPTLPRLLSVLALHRVEVLDETMLENVVDEKDPVMRAWGALLFGERNYPSGPAFQMVVKAAKDTNIIVRIAAAVAARQFVSGALALDTPPRAMHIREVFTGGILSTLWFSTEKSSSPAFELHFWNAVRPISAYDSAHPLGFLNGDREEDLPIAYWISGLITRQIAEQDDPFKQEDGMLMLGQLKTSNPRMMIAALEGLKKGTPQRRVNPTPRSLDVLAKLSKNENCIIAALAIEILDSWKKPFLARE
jgi:hypothetical protein